MHKETKTDRLGSVLYMVGMLAPYRAKMIVSVICGILKEASILGAAGICAYMAAVVLCGRTLGDTRWLMILLLFGLTFAGAEFCSFCPALATSPVLAGMKVSLYLSGFMMILVLVGSFFKRRFWCNICPLGYLIGLAHRVSPFRGYFR